MKKTSLLLAILIVFRLSATDISSADRSTEQILAEYGKEYGPGHGLCELTLKNGKLVIYSCTNPDGPGDSYARMSFYTEGEQSVNGVTPPFIGICHSDTVPYKIVSIREEAGEVIFSVIDKTTGIEKQGEIIHKGGTLWSILGSDSNWGHMGKFPVEIEKCR